MKGKIQRWQKVHKKKCQGKRLFVSNFATKSLLIKNLHRKYRKKFIVVVFFSCIQTNSGRREGRRK
jgi:hypothetical protein